MAAGEEMLRKEEAICRDRAVRDVMSAIDSESQSEEDHYFGCDGFTPFLEGKCH